MTDQFMTAQELLDRLKDGSEIEVYICFLYPHKNKCWNERMKIRASTKTEGQFSVTQFLHWPATADYDFINEQHTKAIFFTNYWHFYAWKRLNKTEEAL